MNATSTVDPSRIDCQAFFRELRAIRVEAEAALGEDDLKHLRRTIFYGRAATAIGLATAWFPNPLSMAALSIGRSTRWIIMHHIGHRGYDKVPGVPPKFTSRVFAKGWRRFIDWPDWMLPEAWKYEHNVLHHTNTGELKDPDLVERNTHWIRGLELPYSVKAVGVALLSTVWKPFYYAPNTVATYLSKGKNLAFTDEERETPEGYKRTLWLQCYAPYVAMQFIGLPALFLPLGPLASLSALINSIGAEMMTGAHMFLVIAPNHTGEDLYRFETPAKSHAESAVRQVLGSANYATGTELVDFTQMWLNYQIEHHLFPDLPMLAYRRIQPKIKALCEKHEIPYVQESLFKRVKQLFSIAIGRTSMKRADRVGVEAAPATAQVS
ncbi:MAG: fatty acid desaturase [Labilithrix sp.]